MMTTFPILIRFSRFCLVLAVLSLSLMATVKAQNAGSARLKDLVTLQSAAPQQLTGYGLVVGLDRTGDRARGTRSAPYTIQSITNMLRRFGVTVDPTLLSSRNAAAVMVTATLDPFAGSGGAMDVTVSALGDARSLSGGVLLQTPLLNPITGEVFAMAQGPVSTGAVLASSLGSSVQVNHTNTGRVPGGGVVLQALPFEFGRSDTLGLVLRRPDFTNAVRISEVINGAFPGAATVRHAGLIQLDLSRAAAPAPDVMARLEDLTVPVDIPARVVINERTGTIVAGGNVHVTEVMITYGSLMIATQEEAFVSQPLPFTGGETVSGRLGTARIEESATRSVVLPPNTDVNQLAAALNELGLTARDVIAIFQAIDRAGALQGELVVL